MLTFLNQYGANYFSSQNGEEGILLECIRRMPSLGKRSVEIGGADGTFCSNTAYLIREREWSGLYVEADYNLYLQCKSNWSHNPNVRSQCSRVDGRNVNAFVDERCDLLSIDTDGHDHEIFCGMKARPKIVIVEIDSSIEPPSERVNSDGGVGYWTMTVAALERGYFVLCHTGNLVLVRQEYGRLFPECEPHPLIEWELYFNRSWLQ
jgi:hypothetical protein